MTGEVPFDYAQYRRLYDAGRKIDELYTEAAKKAVQLYRHDYLSAYVVLEENLLIISGNNRQVVEFLENHFRSHIPPYEVISQPGSQACIHVKNAANPETVTCFAEGLRLACEQIPSQHHARGNRSR